MNALAVAAGLVFAQVPAGSDAPSAEAPRTPPPAAAAAAVPRPAPERARLAAEGVEPAPITTAVPRRRPSPATPPLDERSDAEKAARAFLEALARSDAAALAQASSERFSFDGDVQTGRDAIRRTWRELLAARTPASAPALGALEVLPSQDAAARFGKPPARLAPLVRNGVMVAVGDVGGRRVVLFVAREGGRMAVLGMHD